MKYRMLCRLLGPDGTVEPGEIVTKEDLSDLVDDFDAFVEAGRLEPLTQEEALAVTSPDKPPEGSPTRRKWNFDPAALKDLKVEQLRAMIKERDPEADVEALEIAEAIAVLSSEFKAS